MQGKCHRERLVLDRLEEQFAGWPYVRNEMLKGGGDD